MADVLKELDQLARKNARKPPRVRHRVVDTLDGVWVTDKYGNQHPPPLIDRFLDWVCDPFATGSQAAWCKSNGVAPSTAVAWKRDERVRDLLEKRYQVLNAEPTRVQSVVQAVYERALLGDTKAASLYLQYVDKLTPKRIVIHEVGELRSMSDEQLREQLSRALALLDTPGRGSARIPPVVDVVEHEQAPGYQLAPPDQPQE